MTRRWPQTEFGGILKPGSPQCGSCFVTGTDTGVGKTLVACALVRALRAALHRSVAGMKPVAAGARRIDGALRNDDVDALWSAADGAFARSDIAAYVLLAPLAPHIAAHLEGRDIALPVILDAYARLRAQAGAVVVEGVGGFRVPLGPDLDTADLACALELPVILVVGLRLGCLNHAALTAEAIGARGLHLAGWVANSITPQMDQELANVAALERLLPAPCLGRIPWMVSPDSAVASRGLDVAALLSGKCGR